MLKPLVFAVSAGFSIAAFGQTGQPEWSRAQKEQPAPSKVCDLMSPEEMRMCLVNKPGADVRSTYCDKVSRNEIRSCLKQRESAGSGASSESEERKEAKDAK